MTAEEFYEEFKEALRYVHPQGWCEKREIKVKLKKGKLYFKYAGKEICIDFAKEET